MNGSPNQINKAAISSSSRVMWTGPEMLALWVCLFVYLFVCSFLCLSVCLFGCQLR